MKNKMKNKEAFIEIFDTAFAGMIKREETFVIVKSYSIISTLTLPEGKVNAQYGRVDLIINEGKHHIRVLYDNGKSHIFPFSTVTEKENAVAYLHINNILPTKEEILEAKSLLNTGGVCAFFGCGCD